MFCNRCGIDNQSGSQFCRGCASPIEGAPNYHQQQFHQQQFYQQHQQFGGWNAMPPQKASSRAVTAMVLSVVGLLLCGFFTSIPGMILGYLEMSAINEGRAPQAGSGFAKTGFYGGMVVTGLSFLLILVSFARF